MLKIPVIIRGIYDKKLSLIDFFNAYYPHFSSYTEALTNYIKFCADFIIEKSEIIKNKNKRTIEINLGRYGHLREVVLADDRLNHKEINSLDERKGYAMYMADEDDVNQIFKDGYRSELICYAAVNSDVSLLTNVITILHEMFHFCDPLYRDQNDLLKKRSKLRGGRHLFANRLDRFLEQKILILEHINDYYAECNAIAMLPTMLMYGIPSDFVIDDATIYLDKIYDHFKDKDTYYCSVCEMNDNEKTELVSDFINNMEYFFRFLGKWDGINRWKDIRIIDISTDINGQNPDNSFSDIWKEYIKKFSTLKFDVVRTLKFLREKLPLKREDIESFYDHFLNIEMFDKNYANEVNQYMDEDK